MPAGTVDAMWNKSGNLSKFGGLYKVVRHSRDQSCRMISLVDMVPLTLAVPTSGGLSAQAGHKAGMTGQGFWLPKPLGFSGEISGGPEVLELGPIFCHDPGASAC